MSLVSALRRRAGSDAQFSLFLLVGVFAGVATGIYNTTFSNFLNDVYHLTSEQRGAVEFPRELPGAAIMIVMGLLAFLGDARCGSLGMVAAAIGIAGLGTLSPTYGTMLIWLMLYSLGTHLYMPLTPSIGMQLSRPSEYGSRLALYSAYSLFATIFGYAVVWLGFRYLSMTYQTAFIAAAGCHLLAALTLSGLKNNPPKEKRRFHIVLKKRYTLYYVLSVINGARKQIFLTFAPWVLITEYRMEPPQFAILGVIVAALSIATRTAVGRAIDTLGERNVLSAEAILLIFLCLGYALAGYIFSAPVAMLVIAGCYVLDNAMSVVEMARSTYVQKIAETPADVTPTLAAGVSLDHIVAMSIPFFGGLLWTATGSHTAVFLVAAVIGAANFFLSMRMRVPKAPDPTEAA